MEDPTPEQVAAIMKALRDAQCENREGPYGLYDYSSYPGTAPPHVVRDFREMMSDTYGQNVFRSDSSTETRAEYDRLTELHIVKKLIAAVATLCPASP